MSPITFLRLCTDGGMLLVRRKLPFVRWLLLQINIIFEQYKVMDRTSAQPQINLSLLRSNSSLWPCWELETESLENFLLCDWSMFSSADPSLAAEKMRKNWLVTGSSGMILQNHRWQLPVWIFSCQNRPLGSWKRVTGRIFKISK